MSDGSLSTNGSTILTGVNTLGLMSLLAYTVRNVSEMNLYLDEIRDELRALKSSHVDTAKRSHLAISKINEKLNMVDQKRRRVVPEPKVVELDDDADVSQQVDDVTAAIDELMKP
tara:strand:+ start:1132 stop:1476 length:345 start_codon:yes stop_codon:yes gene_type:complete